MREPEYDDDGVCVDERPKVYEQCRALEVVRSKVLAFQVQHNEESRVGKLELVLFEDAIKHLMTISRVINMDGGSLLLVGVGGGLCVCGRSVGRSWAQGCAVCRYQVRI